MLIGESYIGEGAEAAHVNTVLGERTGPVGVAWATALATPRPGHTPFVAVLIPGLPVKPMTLFVNKAPIERDEHGTLTWGAAQAGVAGGVADAVSEGILSAADADQSLLIAAVWVNPAARDAGKVYANNRAATREALRAGVAGTPQVADVLAARDRPANPFYSAPPASRPPPARYLPPARFLPPAVRSEDHRYPAGPDAASAGPAVPCGLGPGPAAALRRDSRPRRDR